MIITSHIVQLFLFGIKTTTTTQQPDDDDNAMTQQQLDYAVCMWYQSTC